MSAKKTSAAGITRRNALQMGMLAGAALSGVARAETVAPKPARKRVLRFAHITDIHIQPELGSADGLTACLRHLQGMQDPPTLILQGGDAVMDACAVGEVRAKLEAELFRRVLKAECSLPIEHCIGNHDIWGLDKAASMTRGDEAGWGKKWALDLYGLKSRYRTFDRAGWRFIVLDSTFLHPRGYAARLDPEQFAWLRTTLDATDKKTPILVFSHIPILSAAAYFDGKNERTGEWVVPGGWMHIDARAIKDLFTAHPNVKLCISGHIHLVDRVEYVGVTYLCNGAVCAGWWKGRNQECAEGYGLIDLFDDGSFENRYVEFGWKARA